MTHDPDLFRPDIAREATICDDDDLQAKDRVMSNLYFFILEFGSPRIPVPKLRGFHADWLRRRDSCGGNDRCGHATYDELMELYGSIHLDNPAQVAQ